MSAGTRVVTDPDTEVLNLGRVLLEDLVDANNLTVGFLDTAQTSKEVPETGLGNNLVRSEDAHSEELRLRLGLSRKMATNDLVFVHATHSIESENRKMKIR